MLRICSLFALILTLLLPGPAVASAGMLQGGLRVIDGDTFVLGGARIRLQGVDAPEVSDRCIGADGGGFSCGDWATDALRALLAGGRLTCHDLGERSYNRVVARCNLDGQDLGALLVERGIARACPRYAERHAHSRGYMALEEQAIARREGIHAGETPPLAGFCTPGGASPQPATATASQPPSPDCVIKGNISANGRIYHLPGQQFYDRVVVRTDQGQRWFCSEAEAQAAGWRRARR